MSTRNWAVKAAVAYGWQPYHLHKPIVLKSGSLKLLEPPGPVQACNGIALPFTRCGNGIRIFQWQQFMKSCDEATFRAFLTFRRVLISSSGSVESSWTIWQTRWGHYTPSKLDQRHGVTSRTTSFLMTFCVSVIRSIIGRCLSYYFFRICTIIWHVFPYSAICLNWTHMSGCW